MSELNGAYRSEANSFDTHINSDSALLYKQMVSMCGERTQTSINDLLVRELTEPGAEPHEPAMPECGKSRQVFRDVECCQTVPNRKPQDSDHANGRGH